MISLDWRGVALVIIAAGGAAWYLRQQAASLPAAIADPENPVNRAAEEAFRAVTGRDDTPGGWLYEIGHNDGQPGPDNWFFAALDRLTGVDATNIQEVTP